MSIWLVFAASVGLATSQPETNRDWAETLRWDATAIHDAIASSHPGMINSDDPQFAETNEAQYALALDRATSARSFADYFFAIQHYTAAFDDGHLRFGVFGATPDQINTWPGFIAKDDGKRGLVVTLAEPWSRVAVGARIKSCDGRDAMQLGKDRIGARFGRWELASQRAMFASMVMLDTGDPYVQPIRRCVFANESGEFAIDLDWRAAETGFYSRYKVFDDPPHQIIGMSRQDDGAYWITLPTFNGNPESDDGRALEALVAQISAQASALRQAPVVVFDLRGNGGGSSEWSARMAEAIWGAGIFQHAAEPPMTVVWRASEANLESLRDGLRERDANGNLSGDTREWYRASIAGLERAIRRGDDRWIIAPHVGDGPPNGTAAPYHPPIGAVFVLTDGACMSACLDAVDLWTRLGATPIGHETGADTVYMEVRNVEVPSGLGHMSLPMKYYIGRGRGHNQPVVPAYRFEGDMNDTTALQVWVSTLSH